MRVGLSLSLTQPMVPKALPWTPADIANLTVFHNYQPGANCCFVSNGGAASGAGDAVGYAAPLYGSSLSASEATNKPTLRANGLEFAADGSQLLTLSSALGVGATTIYAALLASSGSSVFPVIGHPTTSAFFGVTGATVLIQDDVGATFGSQIITTDAVSMLRFSQASVGGAYRIDSTGSITQTGSALGAMTLETLAQAVGAGGSNDSADNRILAIVAVARNIAFGSTEDLNIRGWFTTNTGATL